MLLFRQFGDRELKENKSKEKSIRNWDVFVTKVRQLDFLLNTEEKHPQLKKKKKGKTYFISFLLPNLHNLGTDKQKNQIFLKTNGFLTVQPYYFEQFLDVNWTLVKTVGDLWILVPAVSEPPREARTDPIYFT